MGVPAGYCGEHPPVNRDKLSERMLRDVRLGETVTEDEFKWKDKDELKYTANELHVKANLVLKE